MATETVKPTDHKLLVAGEWSEGVGWQEVKSPYDGTVVGRVAPATKRLRSARSRPPTTPSRPPTSPSTSAPRCSTAPPRWPRAGRRPRPTIAAEAGKPLKTATVEASRCVDTLTFSAVEARKLTGGTVPMDASRRRRRQARRDAARALRRGRRDHPFNFPLNLVAHKLGPAIAAGNAVVLKPAGQTPITAIKLVEILNEAGLPEGWLNVVPGPGREVGNAIVEHPLVGAITFTGSAPVGWGIRSKAPHKKVNLELGSNAPLIVNDDGDWEAAADKTQIAAFAHAGQVCISIQRILLHSDDRRPLHRAPGLEHREPGGRRPARPRHRRRPADHPR